MTATFNYDGGQFTCRYLPSYLHIYPHVEMLVRYLKTNKNTQPSLKAKKRNN